MTENGTVSRRDRSLLRLAMRVAESSECTTKHGAVLVKGGRVLSLGVNRWRNHPSVCTKDTVRENCSVHAEVDALSRVTDSRGAVLYIARVGRKGLPLLSKPCPRCYDRLEKAGVKRIVYTRGGESWE